MFKKTRKYKIALAVFLFLCIGYLFLSVYCFFAWEIKIDDTTEYSATVKGIYVADRICYLSANEISNDFFSYGKVIEKISNEQLNSLSSGTNIVFRVYNSAVNNNNSKKSKKMPMIVSLKTDSEEIFSLQDFNESRKVDMQLSGCISVIASLVFGIISVTVFIKYKVFFKKIVHS